MLGRHAGRARGAACCRVRPCRPRPALQPTPCSRVKSLEGLRILGPIAPSALRAGAPDAAGRALPPRVPACWLLCRQQDAAGCSSADGVRARTHPTCADAKVVQFYTKLRKAQLLALGLDPAQFQTLY